MPVQPAPAQPLPAPPAAAAPLPSAQPSGSASSARALAEARAIAAQRAAESRTGAAVHAAAYASALARQQTAQAAYDTNRLAYASAKADFDAVTGRATLAHDLSVGADARAEASKRALATLVRARLQQPGTASLALLLSEAHGDNLLQQLGTLDTLSRLTSNLGKVQERVQADAQLAQSLRDQDAGLQALIGTIPLDATRSAMEASEADLNAATSELSALAASAPATFETTPLPEQSAPPEQTTLPDLLSRADVGQLSSQGWAFPAIGHVTDGFGPRPDRPMPGVSAFHRGTDISAACGAAVYAATSGVVTAAGPQGTYGNWIQIDHSNGVETGYAHIADGQTFVSVGESVIAGQVIAGVGSTGASTGCHLHFEVRLDGTAIDARPFLAQRGVLLGD
ncbi:M23 family metallopeptidase [Cryobacterium sp. TmT2-59]|uniref:M23 family metallopeptidase n=1 Tax=Cryobacterium sp. TmT2-59 TaxID=1259264 RepID=UPI00106BDA7B|nr:M23 family metallopeptidase [Cryobacterium sp. TmT2-59]TFC89140.1 M23 family metallopeptidase [Cryobacterium sp. TmT2-59]